MHRCVSRHYLDAGHRQSLQTRVTCACLCPDYLKLSIEILIERDPISHLNQGHPQNNNLTSAQGLYPTTTDVSFILDDKSVHFKVCALGYKTFGSAEMLTPLQNVDHLIWKPSIQKKMQQAIHDMIMPSQNVPARFVACHALVWRRERDS